MSLILGIETSCDETAASVVEEGVIVRSNIIATQHKLHERYGGVVPELASRAHLERISPVISEALEKASVSFADLDAIAVGNRPGLIGSLLVGVSAAKALAWTLNKPLIGIDHVKAHLYAGFMQIPSADPKSQISNLTSQISNFKSPISNLKSDINPFPALGLVISGGHTSLYSLTSPLEMRIIGRTIDDAVGEAYDKAAVILAIGYPGGPRLDKLAQTGDASKHRLPRTLLGAESLDFSYSGLKTALLYAVRGYPVGKGSSATFEKSAADLSEEDRRDLAAAFQEAAVETLMKKLDRAVEQLAAQGERPRSLLIGGGVSANSLVRKRALEFGEEKGLNVRLPAMSLCLDNAAMIAGLAHEHFTRGDRSDFKLEAISTSR